jgi:predicted XRE-type DNA-binding protein
MPQRNNVQKSSNKRQIQLAIQAFKQDASLSQRRAAADFNVPQSTLST